MKISAALSAQVFGGSTATPSKETESTFGGVLEHVADGSASAPAGAAATKLKAPDWKTPDWKESASKRPGATKWALATPTGAAADASDDETPTSRAATKSTATAAVKADDADDGSNDDAAGTTDDQAAATPPPSTSLLALVQIAALAPNTPSAGTTPVEGASISTAAQALTSVAKPDASGPAAVVTPPLPGRTDPSSLLAKAATAPIVSDVTLQSHLAPVNTRSGSVGSVGIDPPSVSAASVRTAAPSAKADASTIHSDASVFDDPAGGGSIQASMAGASGADAQSGQSSQPGTGGARGLDVPETVAASSATADMAPAFDASLVTAQPSTTLSTSSMSAPTLDVADAVTSLASQAAAHATTGVAAARTMLLQLSPAGLGTVSVRLHLTGHTLDVSLTASNAGTASLLDHDRAALTSALGHRDYQLNSLIIQGGDAASTPGGSNASSDSSGHRAASQSTSDQQGGGNARGGARDSSPRQSGQDRAPASAPAVGARGDALFV